MHGRCSLFCLRLSIAWWAEVLLLFRYFWVDTISQEAIDILMCLLLHGITMFVWSVMAHVLPPILRR